MGFAGVVKQSVNCFLQQSLFVVDDAFRGSNFLHLLEPVVAVYNSPVKVVEVAGGEPSAIQLNHRSQFGRQNGENLQNHPLRSVARLPEGFHNLKPLYDSGSFRTCCLLDSPSQFARKSF